MQEENQKNKLYIGNLDYSLTEDELRQAFTDKGIEVREVRIIKDKFSGRSKGFGFTELVNEGKPQEAISSMDGVELRGRKLRVSMARERRPRGEFRPRRSDRGY